MWRTGRLLVSEPAKRGNAELFVAHLDDLRCRLRGFKRIHVICDNASFHDCKRVRRVHGPLCSVVVVVLNIPAALLGSLIGL